MTSKSIPIAICIAFEFAIACNSTDSGESDFGGAGSGAHAGASFQGGMSGDAGGGSAGVLAGGSAGFATVGPTNDGGVSGNESAGASGIDGPGSGDRSGQGGSLESAGASDASAGDRANGGQGAESGEGGGENVGPLGSHCDGCTATPLGSPAWRPAGAALSAGLVGTADTNYQAFFDFIGSVVAPYHTFYAPEATYGPGAAHQGPYTNEGFTLFRAAGVDVKQSFSTSEFTAPSGVLLTLNVVPTETAPLGMSPDFSYGPIIPNSIFPLTVDGDLYREGELYDPAFDFSYRGYDQYDPPLSFPGASHLMLWFGENDLVIPGIPSHGSYEFVLSILDSEGSGWAIHVPFRVNE